jgi:hypothetical protein
MTAGQSTRHYSKVSLAPAPLTALLALALLGGAILGAGITLQLGSTGSNAALAGAAPQPAGSYDAAGFRAEERALSQGQFDAAGFRHDERGLFVARPGSAASGAVQPDHRRGK